MGIIGNPQDAQLIRDWYVEYRRADNAYEPLPSLPEGWARLGEGCYRAAFLSPEGAVYKVQHNYQGYSGQSNDEELDSIVEFHKLNCMPEGTRLPNVTLYKLDGNGSVMAMEAFERKLDAFSAYSDEGRHYWHLRNKIAEETQMWDMHGANLMIDEVNNQLVPVDLGG